MSYSMVYGYCIVCLGFAIGLNIFINGGDSNMIPIFGMGSILICSFIGALMMEEDKK